MESFGDVLLVAQATAQPNRGPTAQWYRDRWERPLPDTTQAGRIRLVTLLYRLANVSHRNRQSIMRRPFRVHMRQCPTRTSGAHLDQWRRPSVERSGAMVNIVSGTTGQANETGLGETELATRAQRGMARILSTARKRDGMAVRTVAGLPVVIGSNIQADGLSNVTRLVRNPGV